MKPLTPRQKQILDVIRDFMQEHGYMPSYREIAKLTKNSSPATIHQYISTLKEKGYLANQSRSARSLEIVESPFGYAGALTVPLAGLITAGKPIEAIEEKETMAVPADFVTDPANTYVLKVRGTSMIDDGILDGDFVVVERNPSPADGDVVVALLDNAYATLKRFYRETNRIRLQPANATMNPIYVQDPTIQGVVRAVIRRFSTV